MKPSDEPTILFEDPHLIVLSKPAGLLSQGERKGDPNLVNWVRKHVGRRYVGLVHRLDRNVSGVMVVAKRTKAARRLSESLREGKLKRTYLAWIQGRLNSEQQWEHLLIKNPKTNLVQIAKKSTSKAKKAILIVKPISYGEFETKVLTLAEFQLRTGRSHQIRVQSATEGYPVLGDTKYGNVRQGKRGRSNERLLLHAHKIEFPHPVPHGILSFKDPLPPGMKQINKGDIHKIGLLGWDNNGIS